MKDNDKNMQHALNSFAFLGGILVNNRPKSSGAGSRPQDYKPTGKK
ncbi:MULTISPECIES: hypothetical protein [Asticcacaulis]|jgi:hypothetical protein|uniref:Uncharacterized protein n=1 Tax=Asticcacaulis endophyticus TaxID=1395890 RepID=A0A918Q341_9CAUL|nr:MULTISPECIES: hypothetical protein [Asticcacaulis]WAC49644.1 hypothetical protein OVA03_07015 [Asticcacaulis sp. SL142]GGZ29084.1 hypothetical protein GCM10011273_13800 [Asticcacaulis endophyticus]